MSQDNEDTTGEAEEHSDKFVLSDHRAGVLKYMGRGKTVLIATDHDGRDRSDEFRIEPETGKVQFRGSEPFSGTVKAIMGQPPKPPKDTP